MPCRATFLGAVLSSILVGCSVPPVEAAPIDQGDEAPTKPTTSTSTPTKSTTNPVSPVVVAPATDPAVTASTIDTTSTASAKTPASSSWSGSVATTATVRFGGQGACDYDVTLTNIEVALALDSQGRATTSKVTALMNETTPQCQFAPLGTLPLEYDYTAPASGAVQGLAFAPLASADNRPQGTLTITGTATSASAIHATLVFHRTDATEDKLNWTVTAEVDLSAQP